MAELFGHERLIANIAHASNLWSPKERIVYLGHANGSSLECAACLDVFVAKGLVDLAVVSASVEPSRVEEGRKLLRRIAAMLTSLSKAASDEDYSGTYSHT